VQYDAHAANHSSTIPRPQQAIHSVFQPQSHLPWRIRYRRHGPYRRGRGERRFTPVIAGELE